MEPKLIRADSQVNKDTGYKCRSVYFATEKAELHYHEYYEFVFTQTTITHIINGNEELVPPNTLLFIRKNDVHTYRKTENDSLSIINIAFREEILTELFEYLTDEFSSQTLLEAKEPPQITLNPSNSDWFLAQIQKLNTIEISDTGKFKFLFRVFLFRVFTRFFADFEHVQLLENVGMPNWLITLDNEMHKFENFSKDIDHMIELSQRSRMHLNRSLNKYFGKSITAYINDIRLNYMANTLVNSDMPIIDIIYECGFNNISWAYSLFKEKYHVSPVKFRKNNQ